LFGFRELFFLAFWTLTLLVSRLTFTRRAIDGDGDVVFRCLDAFPGFGTVIVRGAGGFHREAGGHGYVTVFFENDFLFFFLFRFVGAVAWRTFTVFVAFFASAVGADTICGGTASGSRGAHTAAFFHNRLAFEVVWALVVGFAGLRVEHTDTDYLRLTVIPAFPFARNALFATFVIAAFFSRRRLWICAGYAFSV